MDKPITMRLTEHGSDSIYGFLSNARWDGTESVTFHHGEEEKETRSEKQNNLMHKWYSELAKHTGNGLAHETRYCKLHFGVPIVRLKDNDYRRLYNKAILNLTYEEKLEMMDIWPVTRKPYMKTKMMAEYLTEIDRYASGTHGFVLTHPEDLYYVSIVVNHEQNTQIR